MRFNIIKGAGLDASPTNIKMIIVSTYDTVDADFVQHKVYTESQFLYLIQYLDKLPGFIFGWNFMKYEAQRLNTLDSNFSNRYVANVFDLFKALHFEYNQMISFYKVEAFGANKDTVTTSFNSEVLLNAVKQIPTMIKSENMGYVQAYLEQYTFQFARILRFWMKENTLTLRVATYDQKVYLQLDPIEIEFEKYVSVQKAMDSVPKHALVEVFR